MRRTAIGLTVIHLGAASLACGAPARYLGESGTGEASEIDLAIEGLNARVGKHILRVDRLPRESDFHYECLTLPALPATALCLFNHRMLMNASLARPSYFSENERRVMVPREFIDEVKESRAEGFNMAASTVAEYLERKRLTRPGGNVATDPGELDPLLPSEEVFLKVEDKFQREFLAPFAKEGGGYLIAATAGEGLTDVLSHELQHAQFHHEGSFREIVARYWNETLSEADRTAFREALKGSYDVADERVMQDEFQAYMIMPRVPLDALVPIASTHRAPLLATLRAAGLDTYVDPSTSAIIGRLFLK